MTMQAILFIHIAAGTLAVLAGAAALVFRKGERLHRAAGIVFVAAMTVMGATAGIIGLSDPGNAVAGALVIYLIFTSLITVRRKDKKSGLFEIGGFVVALVFALLFAWSAYQIAAGRVEAENPIILGVTIFLSGVIALAAVGDLSVALRRGVSGAQRIARHLWRMCFALFIAGGSFMAQGADVLPAALPRMEMLLGSMLLVLLVMTYWLIRVLFTKWHVQTAGATEQAAATGGQA
jgi:hypothetical protein